MTEQKITTTQTKFHNNQQVLKKEGYEGPLVVCQ